MTGKQRMYGLPMEIPVDYNVLYDLYYRAGVNLERQRVASPFINEATREFAALPGA